MKLQAGPEDRGLRFDIFLVQHLEGVTRSQIQALNRAGAIEVNGRKEKAGYRIRGGETIEINLKPLEQAFVEVEPIPIHIYYEDDDLAVIEKPAGLVVHPGAGTRCGTLVNALLAHFKRLSDWGGQARPGIVHRLDKWASGLMIIAKNNVAHRKLALAFHDRQIHKTYIALVHGKIAHASGFIDFSIGRHPTVRTRMAAKTSSGRAAYTEYRVLERLPHFSLLELKLRTGRTHQVRVHLSAIGHPVVGDRVYGENTYRKFAKKFQGGSERYFLHAAELEFTHPTTGSFLRFHSPLPEELETLLEQCRPPLDMRKKFPRPPL